MWLDEVLGLLGIKAFPVPTDVESRKRVRKRWVEAIGLERHEAELTSQERVIKRRIKPRK